MIRLSEMLASNAVISDLVSTDKQAVLKELADVASQAIEGLNSGEVFDILSNREKLGSTAIGHGIAIPHGKINDIEKLTAIFGRSKKGIDFNAHDNEPIHLFFVLLAPSTESGNYLHALARLSRLLKNEHLRELLESCKDEDIFQILIDEDSRI